MSGPIQRFGQQLCDALGLDPSIVTSITIHATARDFPYVTVETAVRNFDDVVTVIKQYEWKERDA